MEQQAIAENSVKSDKVIILSVKRGTFRSDDPEKEHNDKEFKLARVPVLEDSEYTCYYCGIKSQKYQEVHHVNDDHSCNEKSNLRTVCCLCHAPFHIGHSGLKKRGSIIYLAGVSQVNLNIIVRTCWIAQDGANEELKAKANKILEYLKQQEKVADQYLTSNAATLSIHLLNMTDEQYQQRGERLEGYLFLPNKSAFTAQLEYWKENLYNKIPTTTWDAIVSSVDF